MSIGKAFAMRKQKRNMTETKTGNISVNTENIFPIIKRSLYSDHDIFLRELVSNAVDATQKLKTLSSIGEFKGEIGTLQVKVTFDEAAKTITISDNGIGMTADEIEKYITQIAFSGAVEFMEKYQDKTAENAIIGQFGLGFYSAFIVAKQVEIQSLSFREGAVPAHWLCEGSTSFTLGPGTRTERGTDIILHLSEDEEDFSKPARIKEVLNKYCKFLPVEVVFEEEVINDTNPLWTKKPSELTDEDYLKFYEKLYPFSEKPLFWIHLNVDYPFNLTGILYFPKIKEQFEIQKNKIQLYCNQVFITDNVGEIVPDFLQLLHGVIDSPDIPLNVSRSALQTDANVRKINAHITKKVADKLSEIFKNDRAQYEEKWPSLEVFVKYGMLSDEKFYEKAKDFCLVQNVKGEYHTLDDYQNLIAAMQTDKNNKIIALYTDDAQRQHGYVSAVEAKGYDVLKLGHVIDPHFISQLEMKRENFQLKRVDSDVTDKLIEKEENRVSLLTEEETQTVKESFTPITEGKEYDVQVEALSQDDLPVVLTRSEFMRRMKEQARTGGGMFGMGDLPERFNLVINSGHPYIKTMASLGDEERQNMAQKALDLALLSQGLLQGEALTRFIRQSVKIN